MRKMEVFYDYACPYCQKGHEYLIELLQRHPDIEVDWHPCESHPRPERFGLHSDLCIQGFFFAQQIGADVLDYHNRMYDAALKKRVNIESHDELARIVQGLLEPSDFLKALKSGKYEKKVAEANDYAYEHSGVWAVPAYRMNGRKLDSIEDVGITKEQLADFMSED